jgi:hypothetical protein
MVGYTSSFGIGGYDVFLVKADKNGNLIEWQKTMVESIGILPIAWNNYGWWFYNCGNDLQFWIR